MQYDLTAEVEIIRVRDLEKDKGTDRVVLETPLTIFLNDTEYITLICSPDSLDCLAVGFLRSEGLIKRAADLEKIDVDAEKGLVYVKTAVQGDLLNKLYGKKVITSGGGKGSLYFKAFDSLRSKQIESSLQVEAGDILKLVGALEDRGLLFKSTGGVHSAALADSNKILFYNEDIGRHNAVDKIVGQCILKEISLEDKILLSSGRISSEVVIKVAKLGLPFIVSRSAPTSLAVELARETGITLVGFARGKRLNIYSHTGRIN
jgi:FdhD protein